MVHDSRPASSHLSGDSVAVVGATCPLGKSLVDALLGAGCPVLGLYRSALKVPSSWSRHPSFHGREFDLINPSTVIKALESCQLIVWLAQHRDIPIQTSGEDLTAIALDAVCTQTAHEHRKVVLLSSGGSIYGNPSSLPVSEDHPCRPLSAYGESKKNLEKALRINVERITGLSGVVLRCGNIYGQHYLASDATGCIGAFARAVLAHEPVTLVAGGLAVRDFVHVDDAVRAILSAITYDYRFTVWNVGSGVGTQIARVLDMVCEILGCPGAHCVNVDAPSSDVKDIVLNIERIERECSWRPRISLRRGLESILAPLRGLKSATSG